MRNRDDRVSTVPTREPRDSALRAPHSAFDVLAVIEALEGAGVACWVDGGWGVDALVGEQTRAHDDLDLVIALDAAARARGALAPLGFALAIDELPTRFVLRAAGDRRIDFHPVTFDEAGNGRQRLPGRRSFSYTAEGLSAWGTIGGRPVRCVSAALQVACHRGYEPDEADRHDMRLLRRRFGLTLPPPYDAP